MHLAAKFHHPMFNRSEIILLLNKHTDNLANKQTPLKISTSLHYATPVSNNVLVCELTALLTLLHLTNNQLHADMHDICMNTNSKTHKVHLVAYNVCIA